MRKNLAGEKGMLFWENTRQMDRKIHKRRTLIMGAIP